MHTRRLLFTIVSDWLLSNFWSAFWKPVHFLILSFLPYPMNWNVRLVLKLDQTLSEAMRGHCHRAGRLCFDDDYFNFLLYISMNQMGTIWMTCKHGVFRNKNKRLTKLFVEKLSSLQFFNGPVFTEQPEMWISHHNTHYSRQQKFFGFKAIVLN